MEIAAPIGRSPPVHHYRRQTLLGGCMVVALAAATAAAVIAATGATRHAVPIALGRALIVGVPLAVGLYAWCCRPQKRFGLLLAATGTGLLVTTFAESGDELLYSVGRAAGWLLEVLVVYVILSFPTGRLRERVDRVLVGAMGAVVLAFFLPRLVLAESFTVPSPYTSCTRDCPANAFFQLDQEPWIVEAVMQPGGALLVLALMVAVLVRLRQRILDATPLARRILAPVLAISALRAALLAVGFVTWNVDRTESSVEIEAWLIAFTVPGIAVAFLVGLLSWRLFTAEALQRLAEGVRTLDSPLALRGAFAGAFNDPSIQVVFPAGDDTDRWIDARGQPVTIPPAGSGVAVREIRNGRGVFATLIHDEALLADPRAIDAAVAMAAVAVENRRLASEAELAQREQRRSSARMAANVVRERRKIERDLHDGAQQRLVALRIEMGLVEDLVRHDPDLGVIRLRELEAEVDEALEELRSLAHGVYPPLLADEGLPEALGAVAARFPIPVKVGVHDAARYPPEVESAVYFCVLEALQNVLKHARGARGVTVHLDRITKNELRFSVRDDGAGTPDGTVRAGAGLMNMRDRLATLTGDIRISSTPGVGTTVSGRVPTRAQGDA
jgi:signal transduction histidine kinase